MPLDNLEQYGEAKAREIQARRERRKVEVEKAAGDSKLRSFWGPKLWSQIQEIIEQRVKAVNDALGERALMYDAVSPSLVTIRVRHVPSNLSAAYDESTARLTLTLDDHSERYDVEMSKGEVKFKAVGYFSPTQVAKMLVDKAASMVL